jgi:ADP-heptose:LPS heptosyltransferase
LNRIATSVQHIVLVAPDGLGEPILCLPVASALRRVLSQATITFLASPDAAPLFLHHPDLDRVIPVTGRERLVELVRIFEQGFDAAVFLAPRRRLMFASWLARIPVRVARGRRWARLLANRRVGSSHRDVSKHESDHHMALLAGLGLPLESPLPPSLIVTREERERGTRMLAALPPSRVVLHPGGAATRPWHGAHYWRLAQRLLEAGFGVILTGNDAERERLCAEASAFESRSGLLDLMGRLSPRGFMGVLAASHVAVCGATWPAHVAAAVGIPTVNLFDPRRTHRPTRWRPLGRGVVLLPDVPICERCIQARCPHWDCLDRITPEVVLRYIEEVRPGTPLLRVLHV